MSGTSRPALQQRVAATILEGAARVFAVEGEHTGINDVAEAAGVARATVYRYFPNRDVLLDELAAVVVADVETRLGSTRLDQVAPEEGIVRVVRALVDVGESFVLLVGLRRRCHAQFERHLAGPVRGLFERGQAGELIRTDISAAQLTEALIGLILGVLTSNPRLGEDDMTATITGLFLDGARVRGPRALRADLNPEEEP